MRIAFLTPYVPYPPDNGGKIRSFHLVKNIALRHQVDLFSVYYSGHAPDIAQVRTFCANVHLYELSKPQTLRHRVRRVLSGMPRTVEHFITPHSVGMVRQYLQRHPYEMIVVDETVMVPFAFALETPRILNLHKIDYQHYWETGAARPWGGRKVLDLLESFKLWRFQRRILSEKYIECIVCSEDDARLVHKMNPLMRTAIVPNGVDCAMFGAPAAGEENTWRDAPTLIYMGTMYYYPNIDAVSYFWHEIYPAIRAQIPNVRLLIVGHQPPPQIVQLQNMPNVVVTGSVPDVRPYLSQSTALIVPLRLGGGTRLKILEAMASGLPVISTSIGAQGLDLEDGKDLLLADEPAEFAAKTVRLLNDPEWCRAFSARGRIVAQRYDWSVLFQRLIDGWTSPINITPSATGVR